MLLLLKVVFALRRALLLLLLLKLLLLHLLPNLEVHVPLLNLCFFIRDLPLLSLLLLLGLLFRLRLVLLFLLLLLPHLLLLMLTLLLLLLCLRQPVPFPGSFHCALLLQHLAQSLELDDLMGSELLQRCCNRRSLSSCRCSV